MPQIRTAQYKPFQHFEYTRLDTIYEPFVFSLDLKLGFSPLSKVYLNQVFIYILGNFTTLIKSGKHISHPHNH